MLTQSKFLGNVSTSTVLYLPVIQMACHRFSAVEVAGFYWMTLNSGILLVF